jgi:hypothetical protein
MKIGDRFEVGIKDDGQYFDVAEGIIEDIDDGIATIVIPATRIQVQVRQSVDFRAEPRHDGPDRILAGETDSGTFATPHDVAPDEPRGRSRSKSNVDYVPDDGVPLSAKELDSSVLD